ncbi:MAG: hypothetical protein WAT39_15260, partial [Planctomycetota bacterium]
MPRSARVLVTALVAVGLGAQAAPTAPPDPVALVAQAEKLLQKGGDAEDAVLGLWQALDLLAALPENPVQVATALSARALLLQHDPREAQRRAAFASVARQQVELATAYRTRKWFETAESRLAVAGRYDRDAGSKERAALAASKPKVAAPPPAAPAAPKGNPFLQRAYTTQVSGTWKEVDGELESAPHPSGKGGGTFCDWVVNAEHADHEVVVEWKPAEPDKDYNTGLWVGFTAGASAGSGYRVVVIYWPEHKGHTIDLWRIDGQETKHLADGPLIPRQATANGWYRLAVQVRGNRLRAQIDDRPPVEAATPNAVRGKVGLLLGDASRPSGAIRWRNFRIDPLPADQPSDDELRAKAAADNQNAITKAVDDAKDLLAKKQGEAASLRLRDALRRVDDLPAGMLRDNLRKSIETMLAQADPLMPKRQKGAQSCAGELGALADLYAGAGQVRAALVLALHAAGFDPDGQAARVAAMREKVAQWNAAQAVARAAELQPPTDDGTQLREWFGKGRKLDTSWPGIVVDGAVARAEIGGSSFATWLPHPLAKTHGKASIHVRLPARGTEGGLYFDVVDQTQFGLVTLHRQANGLQFNAWARLAGKWVPLAQRHVPLDAWRLEAWHQLTVEATEAGVVARCGSSEIKIARKMLGKLTGTFGLYAENETKDPAAIEFRAFQPG